MKGEVRIINAETPGLLQYLKNVWQYRSMIRVLAIRDIKIQYSQTVLGIFWAFLQPSVAVLIYSVFFYIVLGIRTDPVPYPIFVIPGILCWFHFTRIIYEIGNVLNEHQDLIHRIQFPKLVLLVSKLISGMLDVLVTLFLFFVVISIFQYPVTIKVLAFPVFLVLNVVMGLSIAVWLSALTVKFRDLNHIIPYLVSFGIWVTPVFYPTTILPDKMESYLYANPIAGVLAGYRWTLLDYGHFSPLFFISIAIMIIVLILGVVYFIKTESKISDYI